MLVVLDVVVPLAQAGVDDPGGGADQDDAHCHDTGSEQGQIALVEETGPVPQYGLLGGVVDVGAGDQGNQGDDEVGNGRVFPQPGHDLSVDGGHNGSKEAAHPVAKAKIPGNAEYRPGQRAAQSAKPAALAVDVPHKEEAHTGHKAGDAGGKIRVSQGRRGRRDAPENIGRIPSRGGAQSHAAGDQQGGDGAVNAGVGVTEDDIPQSIGKQQSRHQQHQGADDGGINVGAHPQPGKTVCEQRHEEAGGDFLEKGVGMQLAQQVIHDPQKQAAEPGAKTVGGSSAVEDAKTAGNQNVPQQHHGEGIDLVGLFRFLQPDKGLLGIGLFGTDPAAEIVVFFHRIQIRPHIADAAQLGDGKTVGDDDGDKQAVGHRVDPGIQPIGRQHPNDAFLHPIGLSPGHGQPGPQLRGQLH